MKQIAQKLAVAFSLIVIGSSLPARACPTYQLMLNNTWNGVIQDAYVFDFTDNIYLVGPGATLVPNGFYNYYNSAITPGALCTFYGWDDDNGVEFQLDFSPMTQTGEIYTYSDNGEPASAYVPSGGALGLTISTFAIPSAGGSTSINGGGQGPVTVKCGSTVTVTASPNTGYQFVNWTSNGVPVSQSSTYQFTAGTGNTTLLANFALFTFTATDANGTVITYQYVPNNGSLGDIMCTINGQQFLPSNQGGLTLITSSGSEVPPWDSNAKIALQGSPTPVNPVPAGNSVQATWLMQYAPGGVTDSKSLTYTYTFQLVGRTLTIHVKSTTGQSGGLDFDRCENVTAPVVVNVPYLTLMNVLEGSVGGGGVFTSLYADWEKTSASTIYPKDDVFTGDHTSVLYAQKASYLPKTDGTRNVADETINLTVSSSIDDVLPNLSNPQSSFKTTGANYLVADSWEGEAGFATVNSEVQSLASAGFGNLWVILHEWQNQGYDNAYPAVLPANCEFGGDSGLQSLSTLMNESRYLFALHQNYVDFYPDASDYTLQDVARNTNNAQGQSQLQLSWYNANAKTYYSQPCSVSTTVTPQQSYLMKPTSAVNYLGYFSPLIQNDYSTTASFMDVHSSINPSDRIDYDASLQNAGMFNQTLAAYRNLYVGMHFGLNGPVSGEGYHHMLYQGWIDDVEAEINGGGRDLVPTGQTSQLRARGQWLPLLVDFDLYHLHNLATVHGVGYYQRFYCNTDNSDADNTSPSFVPYGKSQVLEYIATELAYGHCGFISTYSVLEEDNNFNYVQAAQLEENYVLPAQKLYANATVQPGNILYNDPAGTGMLSASVYIQHHSLDFTNQSSANFMSQVQVTYNNGVIVCVNRNTQNPWTVTVPSSCHWVDYNATINGTMQQGTGQPALTSYTLPVNCGWAVFSPTPPQ